MSEVGALPTLAPGAIPAAVRERGPEAVQGLRAALGFERVFLAELLSGALPEPEEGADPRAGMLPDALADAIVAQGGIGVAAQLSAEWGRSR